MGINLLSIPPSTGCQRYPGWREQRGTGTGTVPPTPRAPAACKGARKIFTPRLEPAGEAAAAFSPLAHPCPSVGSTALPGKPPAALPAAKRGKRASNPGCSA